MIKKEMAIGFIVGIIANTLGFSCCVFLFSFLSGRRLSFNETIENALQNGSFGNLIVLGAILNLVAFFLFLKQNRPYRAKGVILATLLAAFVLVINKFS